MQVTAMDVAYEVNGTIGWFGHVIRINEGYRNHF